MRWLTRIFRRLLDHLGGYGPKGICLAGQRAWKLDATREVPSFLRALSELLPGDAVLYLEDGTPPRKVRNYLAARPAERTSQVNPGTLSWRLRRFHMPTTRANLQGLAELAENCAAAEIAIHVLAYKEDRVLLEWYDAFYDDPCYLSAKIPEAKVRAFSQKLDVSYEMSDDLLGDRPWHPPSE